jgi:hypothetical protein
MNIWILCSRTYSEKDRFGYETTAVLFLFFQLLQKMKTLILFLHILRGCKFLLNEKEMERFAFSLVLILFVFCGGVSSGNGERVDVSGIIYRLIGIHVISSFSLGDKGTLDLCISTRVKYFTVSVKGLYSGLLQ